MTTAAKEGSPYEGGGGGGAGGKFRKRPYRRPQTTPYDRPPTALRNPSTTNNNNGWLSKLLDPASKLITASAHRFFSSVFRKRLPPPPQPPQPLSEANKESWDKLHEAVSTNPPRAQERTINEGDNQSNNSDSGGFTELEQILNQKTFTRSEIDRLTALLDSRTDDIPVRNEEKRPEANLSEPVAAHDRQEELSNSPVQENGIESHRLLGVTSTPIANSRVLEDDVASPIELAKSYMASRLSKVSPSMLGLRSQAFREDSPLLSNLPFPPKSPIMSLVPKSSVHVGVPENGFMTPRSRGRSAIYSMARTPYSRIHPTTSYKGYGSTIDAYGGPSSSSQFTLEQNRLSGSKQAALKRKSSILDNDIGSVGPIRRIRQKPNLLSSKSLSLPVSGSPLSITGSGVVSKLRTENVNNSIPGTSFGAVPSQSSEMAQKILQQLEKLVPSPKEKSSEIKLATAREKLPARLTPDMLSGQALRSLENVDSSKVLENVRDNNKLVGSLNTYLPDARDSTSQKQDKVEENGPTKFMGLRDRLAPAVNGVDTTVLNKDTAYTVKIADSAITHHVAYPPPQKKRAFQMSAHEDYFDLDDDGYSNGSASTPLGENLDTLLVECRTVAAEAVMVEKPPALPEVKPPASSVSNKRTDLETSHVSVVAEKSTGFTFPVAPAASMTIQPTVLAPQSTSTFDKVVPPKEPNAAAPIFSFSSKNVDKVPPFTFSSSSSVVSESSGLKSGALSDPKLESSSCFETPAAADAVLKVPESDKGYNKNTQKADDLFRKPETAFSSAVSTSTSTTSIFSFGAPAINPSLNNGSLASSPSTFSSPTPILNFNNVTNQNLSNTSTVTAAATTTTTVTSSNSNLSTSAAVPSFQAAPIFKFGSSISPSTSVSQVSATSVVESTDTQVKNKQETIFGNLTSTPFGGTSSAIASTGSGFGFSASATSSTVNNQSQGSTPFGTGSESLVSAQSSPAGAGVANFTHSMPIQFGSSASSSTFGLTGTTAFASSNSLFGSSTPATGTTAFASGSSLFGSSTPATKLVSSGPSFGLSSLASSSEANSISTSSGTTSSLFGSNWQQPSKSPPIFGSTFNSTAPSTGFSFGASSASIAPNNGAPMVFGSSTGTSMGSMFSFTSAAANTPSSTSLSPSQPVFGNPNSVFPFGNNDQMNMEDSMAEDTVQASTPAAVPIFGQPSISSLSSSGFGFGSTAPSGANPFQFGGQQNPAMPQNPSPFQASGSLDFNAGGSFSLGTGGDKSNRKMIKVKHKQRKK